MIILQDAQRLQKIIVPVQMDVALRIPYDMHENSNLQMLTN